MKLLSLLMFAGSLAGATAALAGTSAINTAATSSNTPATVTNNATTAPKLTPLQVRRPCKTAAVLEQIKQLQSLIDYRKGLIADFQAKIDATRNAQSNTDDPAQKQKYEDQIYDLTKKRDALIAAQRNATAELEQKQALPAC